MIKPLNESFPAHQRGKRLVCVINCKEVCIVPFGTRYLDWLSLNIGRACIT